MISRPLQIRKASYAHSFSLGLSQEKNSLARVLGCSIGPMIWSRRMNSRMRWNVSKPISHEMLVRFSNSSVFSKYSRRVLSFLSDSMCEKGKTEIHLHLPHHQEATGDEVLPLHRVPLRAVIHLLLLQREESDSMRRNSYEKRHSPSFSICRSYDEEPRVFHVFVLLSMRMLKRDSPSM